MSAGTLPPSMQHRVEQVGECLIWQGATQTRGYGSVAAGVRGLTKLAHRAAYEHAVGPIPEGMTIDHLCCEKRCVNVEHMEVVTRGENSRRMLRKRTHCKHGHAIEGDNLRLVRRPTGIYRVCVTCHRKAVRESMRRSRAAERLAASP